LCYAHGEARTVEKEDGVTVTDGALWETFTNR